MKNIQELLVEQLKDLYSAETQLIEALPTVVKAATTAELKEAIQAHLAETKEQLQRLDKVSKLLEEKLTGETCQAMKGLIKECSDIIKAKDYEIDALKDAMIISIAQKIEHYEIAGYGNAVALATYLDLEEVAALLDETLGEEENADETLTEVTQVNVLPACSEEIPEEPEEDEEEEEEDDQTHART